MFLLVAERPPGVDMSTQTPAQVEESPFIPDVLRRSSRPLVRQRRTNAVCGVVVVEMVVVLVLVLVCMHVCCVCG